MNIWTGAIQTCYSRVSVFTIHVGPVFIKKPEE